MRAVLTVSGGVLDVPGTVAADRTPRPARVPAAVPVPRRRAVPGIPRHPTTTSSSFSFSSSSYPCPRDSQPETPPAPELPGGRGGCQGQLTLTAGAGRAAARQPALAVLVGLLQGVADLAHEGGVVHVREDRVDGEARGVGEHNQPVVGVEKDADGLAGVEVLEAEAARP